LKALSNYWSDQPPVHVLVAAYLGLKPKGSSNERVNDPNDLAKLAQVLGRI
jgi:hypothetical protein